jgi:hypothetical protein
MANFLKYLKWLRHRNDEIELQNLAVGLNSSVNIEENIHILMLDYDIKDLGRVKESVRECQEFWNLADAYIYKTKNGFHALFYYDLMPFERCKMIIDFAKYVDPMFKYISKFYSHKTLRAAGKHKDPDIRLLLLVPGMREPNGDEWALGEMKRREHKALLPQHIHKRRKLRSRPGQA